jgi:polysaccharide biosynthesis transport protein
MNRRLIVFLTVFLIVCAGGLGYTYSIPPTYVATATIQVEPATVGEHILDRARFTSNEAQTLNSNEIFERLLERLRGRGPTLSGFGDAASLREVLTARAVPGTNTIELQARGSDRSQLAGLVDLWAATYLETRAVRRTGDRTASVDEARASVSAMEARVARKRADLDDFRRRHDIVSPEREENEVAAQMRSLTTALNDARNKLIDAESRVSAIQAGMANGAPVYRAQDKAVINQLEQQILDLRQKFKDLELKYTPEYLAVEPGVKTMRANLRQLEQQVEKTQKDSQQATLNEAMQDVVLAKKNVSRLEAQLMDRRADAQKFTSQFAEHKARASDLTQIEAQLGQAKERLARLEGTERAREARYELLGGASVPDKPAHPDYTQYTAFSIGGALLAALLAVVLVDFLSPKARPEAMQPPIIQIAYPSLPSGSATDALQLPGRQAQLPRHTSRLALEAAQESQRELTVPEVHALWDAATKDGRLAIAALFSGVTFEELALLSWRDVDLDRDTLQFHEPERTQPLLRPLRDELHARVASADADALVATSSRGTELGVADLAGLVAAAAHDAGLEHAEEVDARVLRHTYISFLVKQGLRLSELEKAVGLVPAASFLQYRTVSPRGPGLPLEAVNCIFPAFGRA